MKNLILIPLLFLNVLMASGQTYNSLPGISFFPRPDTTQGGNPQLGITLDAYNNCNYEYTFDLIVKDSFQHSSIIRDIVAVKFLSVDGLPNGINNLQCDPPSCLFPPNTAGTVTISGVPNDIPDDYILALSTEVTTLSTSLPLNIVFPNLSNDPGEYRLTLEPNPPTCLTCSGFSVQLNKTNDRCETGSGSFSFIPSGGTPPYSYAINTVSTTNTSFSGLYAGIYVVEILDAIGCKLVEAVEIIGGSSISVSSTNESCLFNDGNAVLTNTGSNFSYLWNTGATTQSITGLSTGFYAVTTTNTLDLCTRIDTTFVEQDSSCIVYLNGQIVWDDLNPDCMVDATSRYPENKMVFLYKNGQLIDIDNTDLLGQYAFTADTGVYVIRHASGPYEVSACPTTDSVVVNALTPFGTYQEDFYQTLIPHQDVCISYVNGPARPGFLQWHTVTYCNLGTDTISTTITLVHDPILTNFDASGTEDSYDAVTNTAVWSFTNLPPGACEMIHFNTLTPASTALGEILANTVTVGPSTNDVNPENNSVTLNNIVVGAYDPNDKQNLIAKSTFSGPVLEDDDQFHYYIRFQNTGTDTAFTVVVKDDIDPHLKLTSLRPIASSHNYDMTIENQRTVVFTFNNILLVDSTTNEPGSHGYISFTIDLADPNSPVGTVIENEAGIYFDFNAPIITNTVVNTISNPVSVEEHAVDFSCSVYPNPTDALVMLQLNLQKSEQISVELVDLTGKRFLMPYNRKMFEKGAHNVPLNLEGLPDGIWFVHVRSATSNLSLKLMKME